LFVNLYFVFSFLFYPQSWKDELDCLNATIGADTGVDASGTLATGSLSSPNELLQGSAEEGSGLVVSGPAVVIGAKGNRKWRSKAARAVEVIAGSGSPVTSPEPMAAAVAAPLLAGESMQVGRGYDLWTVVANDVNASSLRSRGYVSRFLPKFIRMPLPLSFRTPA
jgi:hypothetical protein